MIFFENISEDVYIRIFVFILLNQTWGLKRNKIVIFNIFFNLL